MLVNQTSIFHDLNICDVTQKEGLYCLDINIESNKIHNESDEINREYLKTLKDR